MTPVAATPACSSARCFPSASCWTSLTSVTVFAGSSTRSVADGSGLVNRVVIPWLALVVLAPRQLPFIFRYEF